VGRTERPSSPGLSRRRRPCEWRSPGFTAGHPSFKRSTLPREVVRPLEASESSVTIRVLVSPTIWVPLIDQQPCLVNELAPRSPTGPR
jgi:hypothetical protein